MRIKERFTSKKESEKQSDNSHDLSKIQERHPDWPKLSFSFFYSPHNNAEDTKGIGPYLEDADVLLYEHAGPSDETTKILNIISTNPEKAKEMIDWDDAMNSYYGPMIESVRGTSKVVGNIDIGDNDGDEEIVQQIAYGIGYNIPRHMEYADAMNLVCSSLENAVTLQNWREDTMLENLEGEMDRIFQSRPDLKGRNDINVLIQLGSYHTRLSHIFAKSGVETKRHFPDVPYVYGYQTELQRNFTFNIEPSNDLIQRAIAESIARYVLKTANSRITEAPTDMQTAYLRSVISKLSAEDMEDLYDAYKDDYLTVELMDTLLASRDLYRVPRSNDELEFLVDELMYRNKMKLAKAALAS